MVSVSGIRGRVGEGLTPEVVIMSNRSRPSTDSHAQLAFGRDEWELVVTLPRRVLLAAVAVAGDGGRRIAEDVAGIEAIASGLASTSPLVREIVAAIYAESHHEPQAAPGGAELETVRTLAACRYAAQVVAARRGPGDADAYREWLLDIALAVSGAGPGALTPAQGRGPGPAWQLVSVLDAVLRP